MTRVESLAAPSGKASAQAFATFGAGMLFASPRPVTRLLLLPLLCIPLVLPAQDKPQRFFETYKEGTRATATDTPATGAVSEGRIVVNANPGVEKLMERYAATKHPQKGYRVQIFLGSDRKAAEEIKRTFLLKNPESTAYLSWLAPNWRLRVGDLRTRVEAERLLRDTKVLYPGSYIVPDDIEMPVIISGK